MEPLILNSRTIKISKSVGFSLNSKRYDILKETPPVKILKIKEKTYPQREKSNKECEIGGKQTKRSNEKEIKKQTNPKQ